MVSPFPFLWLMLRRAKKLLVSSLVLPATLELISPTKWPKGNCGLKTSVGIGVMLAMLGPVFVTPYGHP
jgi:hypothetical protein